MQIPDTLAGVNAEIVAHVRIIAQLETALRQARTEMAALMAAEAKMNAPAEKEKPR